MMMTMIALILINVATVVTQQHCTALPGNGSVILREVYKMDCKWHGAHCQHIHNFEG